MNYDEKTCRNCGRFGFPILQFVSFDLCLGVFYVHRGKGGGNMTGWNRGKGGGG